MLAKAIKTAIDRGESLFFQCGDGNYYNGTPIELDDKFVRLMRINAAVSPPESGQWLLRLDAIESVCLANDTGMLDRLNAIVAAVVGGGSIGTHRSIEGEDENPPEQLTECR
jgi:hypothetical protein